MDLQLDTTVTVICGGRRLVCDELPLALLVCGGDGSLCAMTPAARDLLGDPGPTGPDALVALLTAAGVAAAPAALAASLREPQEIRIRRDGRERPALLRGWRGEAGTVAYTVTPASDDAERAAQRAEFQSLIAHDLRSPLAVIQGYAGLLATGHAGPLTATQQEFLNGIDGKIGELVRLLDDFLDYQRLEAGALTLAPEPVGLGEMIGRLVEEYAARARRRNLRLAGEARPEDLQVVADPLRLRQVLDNLVGNAVKYADDGTWVQVEAFAEGAEVVIAVSDGGPGIPAAERPLLFEPYRRGGDAHGAGGAGLGLVVVRRLVERHGGCIALEESSGGGSRFVVRLPRNPSPDGRTR